jgi:hypothetical protein
MMMRPNLKYFAEGGEEHVNSFIWETAQPFNTSFSRGVKWESHNSVRFLFLKKT